MSEPNHDSSTAAGASAPAEPAAPPFKAFASLFRDLHRIQRAELEDITREIVRAQTLLREAVGQLMPSFQRLTADTLQQQTRVQGLLVDMSGAVHDDTGDGAGLNIAAFVNETEAALEGFAEVLVHFSKQSVTISYKIDDMVDHMDAIFELVSQVDSIAEEINILAINAALEAARAGESGKGFKVVASEIRSLSRDTKGLNDRIGDRVDSARAVITDVRAAARAIASQDMSIALSAKGGVDTMLGRLHGMDGRISDTLDEVSQFADRVRANTNEAIRSMQFDDVVGQLLEQVKERTEGLLQLTDSVRDTAQTYADSEGRSGLPQLELQRAAAPCETADGLGGDIELF